MQHLREMILRTAANAGEGHIPSAFSVLDILWVLYDKVLRIDPKFPKKPERDYFILSKGQASLGLYAVLATKGFFPLAELEGFVKYDGILGGHPDRNKIPGVEASTGSLGHGFPMGVGIALGLRIKKIQSRVVALIGDGEMNEGSVWEAALVAGHHKMSNLYCIVDYNHSTDRALKVGDVVAKFRAFDWESFSINGHDQEEILKAFNYKSPSRPTAIIAETIKGFGCTLMENNPEWHHKAPRQEELPALLKALT